MKNKKRKLKNISVETEQKEEKLKAASEEVIAKAIRTLIIKDREKGKK